MPKGIPKKGINTGRFKKTTVDVTKKCAFCFKDFIVPNHRDKKAKFCSYKCYHSTPKNKKVLKSCELCNKEFFIKKSEIKKRRFCSRSCRAKVISKRKHTQEEKDKIGLAHIGKKCPWNAIRNKLNPMKKDKHPNWKGGISTENNSIRTSTEYKLWHKAVFERDKWRCVWCGSKKRIHADHIQLFSTHPELRFAIDNGRTLCRECHYKRHSSTKTACIAFQKRYNIEPAEGNFGPLTKKQLKKLYP